jgi:GT2 family glycosyltransferase
VKTLACVVSWNSASQLAQALQSLHAQRDADLDVVVVDNASADASRDVAARFPDARLVANPTNRGYAGAANQAVALARDTGAEALLLCNPDIRLADDYISRAVAVLGADPRRAAVQGRLWRLPEADPPIIDTTGHLAFATRLFRNRGEGTADVGQHDTPDEIFGVSGAVALYRLGALDDVACDEEVFDEDLFAFWEDVDLDWRLQLRGWQAWFAPDARGWHERGGAGPRRSPFVEELKFANRFLVFAKNDHLPALARAFPGVALTSALKAGELAVTVPSAFLRSFPRARLLPRMLAKRRRIQTGAVVDPAAVIARWFGPFDYSTWVRTWWRRVGPASRQVRRGAGGR